MFSKAESIQVLKKYFEKNKITSMPELFELLGTKVRMSIFRKLSDLNYISSYSNKGQYYTLPSVIIFNNKGLYHHDAIGFSRYGNLKKTIIQLVGNSMLGYTHKELEELLKLEVYDTLLLLVKSKQLSRKKIDNCYVYFCISKDCENKQLAQRHGLDEAIKNKARISKILIIEVLAAIIRINQPVADTASIISMLKERKIVITEKEVEQILFQHHLKKTPD